MDPLFFQSQETRFKHEVVSYNHHSNAENHSSFQMLCCKHNSRHLKSLNCYILQYVLLGRIGKLKWPHEDVLMFDLNVLCRTNSNINFLNIHSRQWSNTDFTTHIVETNTDFTTHIVHHQTFVLNVLDVCRCMAPCAISM